MTLKVPSLLIRNVRTVSPPPGKGFRCGPEAGELEIRDGVDVLVGEGRILAIGSGAELRLEGWSEAASRVVEGDGHALLPGFVDAHTHACWAGNRLDEWALRLKGASYPEILRAGGGIHSTVREVRAASEEALARLLRDRLEWALREGTTTIEVKSGYGLDTPTELKMLRAIRRAGADWPGTVIPTACIGHAKDPEIRDFVGQTIEETLPAVHEAFPGVAIDAYCEEGAWSVDECVRLFEAAAALGHPLRVHADQFTEFGMMDEAIRLGARSVDHLEATTREGLGRLARSGLAGVFLPVSGFHVDGRYGDARTFVDEGGAPVVATNWNPGSAPSPSIPFAVSLAVRHNGLTPAEALTAVTANAAHLLRLHDRGSIFPGMRADLVLLRHRDEREVAHTVGGSPVALVVVGGEVAWQATDFQKPASRR